MADKLPAKNRLRWTICLLNTDYTELLVVLFLPSTAQTEQQDIVEQSFENSDYTRIIELGKHRAKTKMLEKFAAGTMWIIWK